MTVERRTLGTEVRAEARRLSGTILRFGEVSPTHRERFLPGSLRLAEAIHLDLFHDREKAVAWHPGGGLSLSSDERAVTMRAELPPIPAADRALEEVRSGRATGLSVEFHAMRESRDGDIRVVEDAVLSGIGIVRAPSYEKSRVEARARSGRTMRATIPADAEVECKCSGVQCKWAEIIGPAMQEMFDEVFEEAKRQIVAGFGNYDRPLASTATGTIRGRILGNGDGEVEVDLPVGPEGDLVLRAHENAGVIVRPFLDADASEGEVLGTRAADGGNVMRYTKASMRALLISSTDAREGWPAPTIIATPGMDERSVTPRTRRRSWLWL